MALGSLATPRRCRRLGLTTLAYLWQEDQQQLVESMLACEMEPVLVKVAAYGAARCAG